MGKRLHCMGGWCMMLSLYAGKMLVRMVMMVMAMITDKHPP